MGGLLPKVYDRNFISLTHTALTGYAGACRAQLSPQKRDITGKTRPLLPGWGRFEFPLQR